jgi:hypothetical protein
MKMLQEFFASHHFSKCVASQISVSITLFFIFGDSKKIMATKQPPQIRRIKTKY